jgi:hypothetical protein
MQQPPPLDVGEELTYDYRFMGEEQLRCNCGAATCRGMVNQPPRRIPGLLDSASVPAAEVLPVGQREVDAWHAARLSLPL